MRKISIQIVSLSFLAFFISACGAKSTEVQISSFLKPKYEGKGYKKVYLADFIITGKKDVDRDVNINVNKEIKETLKTEFKENRRSEYEMEDLKVEFGSEKTPEEILKDSAFWSSLGIEDKEGSLIFAGVVEFTNQQKSGLVTDEITNPRSGSRRTITSSREQLQIILGIDVYLFDAQSGEKLFQEKFEEEEVYDGVSNVTLPLFYDIFERVIPKIVGILIPYRVKEARSLMEP